MVIFHSYVSLPEGMTTVVDCMSSFATSFGAPTEKISAEDQPEGPWWLYQCCYGKACSPCPLINFPVICARLNEKRLLIIWIFWISIVLDVNIDNIRFKFNGCKHKTIYKTYIFVMFSSYLKQFINLRRRAAQISRALESMKKHRVEVFWVKKNVPFWSISYSTL